MYVDCQLLKIANNNGEWNTIKQRRPPGFNLGPFMFNVFQNNLILKLEDMCNIYNYADDNTIGCRALTISELIVCDSIMNVSKTMISCCNVNYTTQKKLRIFINMWI